ncbi:MAG: MFS transporter [Desulfobulbaceae bacterium]|nr:MFS transporter [Desulfobulbaceae bacterium]
MHKTKTFQTGNVVIISISHMVHDIYAAFLAPILPLIIEKLGMTYAQAGFLSVIQRAPSLLNPFIGIIADRVSVRYFIIISPLITGVCMSLLGMAPSYTVIGILLFVMGISSTLFHVPAPVMISEVAAGKIGRGMSFYMLGGELARTAGPLVILGAVSLWGLEGTYKLVPFAFAASLVLFIKLKNIKISDKFKKVKKENGARETFVNVLPLFITLGGIIFFRAFMKGALTTFLPTYLHLNGASLWMAGISLSILQAAGAAGTIVAGTLSDRIGRRKMMIIISIASPVLMWLFIISDSFFALPILILLGFFLFATGPVMLAVVNNLETDRPAFVNGIYMTLNFSISALTIMLIGLSGDILGFVNTYKFAAVLALCSIPFAFRLSK